jgi:hypothetical protein
MSTIHPTGNGRGSHPELGVIVWGLSRFFAWIFISTEMRTSILKIPRKFQSAERQSTDYKFWGLSWSTTDFCNSGSCGIWQQWYTGTEATEIIWQQWYTGTEATVIIWQQWYTGTEATVIIPVVGDEEFRGLPFCLLLYFIPVFYILCKTGQRACLEGIPLRGRHFSHPLYGLGVLSGES